MSQGYRHRAVRPLYPPYPDSVCDCALLPSTWPSQLEDLVHTREVQRQDMDIDLQGRSSSLSLRHHHCPTCGTWWWAWCGERIDLSYDRADETRVIGSTVVTLSQAVACTSEADLPALDEWLPQFQRAVAARDRIVALGHRGSRAAIEACIALAERDARTRQLSESQARSAKLAAAVCDGFAREMASCVERLQADPTRADIWPRLQALQSRCAGARLEDPARELTDFRDHEWWTPALAPLRALEWQQAQQRPLSQGARLGSAEHLAWRACEDAVARCWNRHMGEVQWPHPEAEFSALLSLARRQCPMWIAGDLQSWNFPDALGRRIKELLQSGNVRINRHVDAPPWLAVRTGLPDAVERHQERARANYWLPIRRAVRRVSA